MVDKHLPLAGIVRKEDFVGLKKLVDESLLDHLDIVDDPATIFKVPIIGKTQNLPRLGEIGEKRECPASQRTAVALAVHGTLAFHRLAGTMQFIRNFARNA